MRKLLEAPWLPLLAAAVAALLCLPSLGNGLALDDRVHDVILDGTMREEGLARAPWDLFAFVPGDPVTRAGFERAGTGPWWAAPGLRLSFFRPLAAATVVVDRALFGDAAWPKHLHSLLWLVALVLVAGATLRRLLGPGGAAVAGLATLLFALDDAHGLAVGWLANRNALIAGLFALLSLLLYDLGRREGVRWAAWLSPLALAAGIAGGELALSILGCFAGHAAWLDRAPWPRRLIALLPHALVVVAYGALYATLGYGARGSGFYVDPVTEPQHFLPALLLRAPLLLGSALGLPLADFGMLLEGPALLLVAVPAALSAAAVLVAAWPLVRDEPALRALLAGAALSVVPLSATAPNDRLLLLTSFGSAAIVARLLLAAKEADPRLRRSVSRRAVVLFALVVHVLVAAPQQAFRSASSGLLGRALERSTASLPSEAGLSGDELVIVDAPDFFFGAFQPIWLASMERPRPASFACLGVSHLGVEVETIDERTLQLRPRDGYLATFVDTLLRARHLRFEAGMRFPRRGHEVEVVEITDDGRPALVRVRFGTELRDPRRRWVTWGRAGYVPFEPPPPGGRIELPPVDPLALLLGA